MSFANGCRLAEPLTRRGNRGDEQKGEDGKIDLFGSRAKDRGSEAALWFASVNALTSDCGPKEKEEPIECLGRELDGDGKFGIAGIAKFVCGGGVEVVLLNIELDVDEVQCQFRAQVQLKRRGRVWSEACAKHIHVVRSWYRSHFRIYFEEYSPS